jgi:UDPglucose 6-dehydrogenase
MPLNVAKDILEILAREGVDGGSARILLLGWSYKPGIGDARETPAEPLAAALRSAGCTVEAFDPHVDGRHFPSDLATLVGDLDEVSEFDLAILVTAHDEVVGLDWAALGEKTALRLIYDGRRVLDGAVVEGSGWTLYRLGAPL